MSTSLQVSLLSFHMGNVRTSGGLLATFMALFSFAYKFNAASMFAAQVLSVCALAGLAYVSVAGTREYQTLVAAASGEIPPDRVRALLWWTRVSYGLAAVIAAACVLGAGSVARRAWRTG